MGILVGGFLKVLGLIKKDIPLNPPSKGDFTTEFPPLKGGKGGC